MWLLLRNPVSPQIPTDGLILKGWYRIVTFAVYGRVAVVKAHQESPPPPPPPLSQHPALGKSKSSYQVVEIKLLTVTLAISKFELVLLGVGFTGGFYQDVSI